MRKRWKFLAALAFVLSAACSRPATQGDCTKIVERSVEMTLKEMNRTPEEIAKQKGEATAKLEDRIRECVGKRITNRMLRCVDGATSSDEIASCIK